MDFDSFYCGLTKVTHIGEIGYIVKYPKVVGVATKDLPLPIVGGCISRPSCWKCSLEKSSAEV